MNNIWAVPAVESRGEGFVNTVNEREVRANLSTQSCDRNRIAWLGYEAAGVEGCHGRSLVTWESLQH